MSYEILFTREALKDIILNQISPEPAFGKKLVGDLTRFYSVRLTYKDRIVCSFDSKKKIGYIHGAKTHCNK